MLEINIVTVVKHAFVGFINRPDIAQEIISKLDDMLVETLKTKKQREKRFLIIAQTIQELWVSTKVIHTRRILE